MSATPFSVPSAHASGPAHISLDNATTVRGGTPVFSQLSISVTHRSRLAIVGENGRGKSTLLHVLDGRHGLEAGTIARSGTVHLVEQEMRAAQGATVGDVVAHTLAEARAALAELNTAADAFSAEAERGQGEPSSPHTAERYAAALDRAEALDAWDAERRVRIALDALSAETDWSRPLAQLSVGHRYRVRLACALGGSAGILLCDEPSNHLDRRGIDFLTEQLRSRSGGVVLVSHDRALLADVADTVLDLDPTPDGVPRHYGDGFAGYLAGRRALHQRWEQDFAAEQMRRAQLADALSSAQNRLSTGWRPPKGSGKHQRATRAAGLVQSVHRRQEAVEQFAVAVPEPPLVVTVPSVQLRRGAPLVTAEALRLGQRLSAPVTLHISGGDRTVVVGPNGAGKSTLLALVAGAITPTSGRIHRAEGVRIAWLGQETELEAQMRASDVYARRMSELVSRGVLGESEVVGLSSLGLLRAREASKAVGELSVGQQRRLDLALVLAMRPHVLLLDEPSNHLSIALVDELVDALTRSSSAVVLATHDRQLLRDCADWQRCTLGGDAEREV